MRPQAMDPNPLSGNIICSSICLFILMVVSMPFAIFVFVLIFIVGGRHCNAFIRTLGSEEPLWGLKNPCGVQSILYVCLYLCLSICYPASIFVNHKIPDRKCVLGIQLRATDPNPLSGSIILPSLHLFVRRLFKFIYFYWCPVLGPIAPMHLSPIWVQSNIYGALSVSMSGRPCDYWSIKVRGP